MVNRSPMRDNGLIHFRNTWSYHRALVVQRRTKRVRIAAPRGIPRNTATLLAAVLYSNVMVSPLMTSMKNTPIGAKRTIWRRELMATRIAQYSLSPPARPVQIKTWLL